MEKQRKVTITLIAGSILTILAWVGVITVIFYYGMGWAIDTYAPAGDIMANLGWYLGSLPLIVAIFYAITSGLILTEEALKEKIVMYYGSTEAQHATIRTRSWDE